VTPEYAYFARFLPIICMYFYAKPPAAHPHQAKSLQQAVQDAPSLAHLSALASESGRRLALIATLMPPALRTGVLPGPIEQDHWCLIATNNAVAAKLRQLTPAFAAHLRSNGVQVTVIRIKVKGQQSF
jgi:hypothetical protein